MTLLARLGLRANEVATLTLDDVDWRAGEVGVTGKGDRRDRLPLPVDVGQAVAEYCQHGRPTSGYRSLFVLASGGVSEALCKRLISIGCWC